MKMKTVLALLCSEKGVISPSVRGSDLQVDTFDSWTSKKEGNQLISALSSLWTLWVQDFTGSESRSSQARL